MLSQKHSELEEVGNTKEELDIETDETDIQM